MMRRSLLTGLFILFANASNAATPMVNPADAVAFMNQLWGRAVEVLNNKTDPSFREAQFSRVVPHRFRLSRHCAIRTSGRYWRTASEEEQQEFVKLFEDYVVFVYTARLSNFGGEALKVRGSRSDGDGVIVSTDVISPGGASPMKIDWRLVTENGTYKISDVIVEGISMMATQRSEFASVVQRNGGQVRGLIAMMREKTASAAR